MNSTHREQLIHFFLRKAMYINPVNRETIISFLMGFECGERAHVFTSLLKEILTNKYKLPYSNTGWLGQIEKLTEREGDTWVNTMTKLSLYILCEREEELTEQAKECLKHVVDTTIYFAGSERRFGNWENDWASLTFLKHKWARTLWTAEQWKVIARVDKLVKEKQVFKPIEPTLQMAALREKWEGIKEKKKE